MSQLQSQASRSPELLFVYGSLRPDSGSPAYDRYLAASINRGRATIPGELYQVSWFPGVKPIEAPQSEGSHEVIGYVFEVTEAQLLQMDIYEGAPSLFRRERTVARFESGELCHPWVYYYNNGVSPEARITSGDFMRKETAETSSVAATGGL